MAGTLASEAVSAMVEGVAAGAWGLDRGQLVLVVPAAHHALRGEDGLQVSLGSASAAAALSSCSRPEARRLRG